MKYKGSVIGLIFTEAQMGICFREGESGASPPLSLNLILQNADYMECGITHLIHPIQ